MVFWYGGRTDRRGKEAYRGRVQQGVRQGMQCRWVSQAGTQAHKQSGKREWGE